MNKGRPLTARKRSVQAQPDPELEGDPYEMDLLVP